MLNLLFIISFISVSTLLFSLVVETLNLVKSPFGKNRITFAILSANVFVLSLGSIILLTSTNIIMLNIWSNIIIASLITMPAIIFHFAVQFANHKLKRVHKNCIKIFYSLSVALSASLIIFNQIGIQDINYGYIIRVPNLIYIQIFFTAPISIATIFIISYRIFKNARANKSTAALSLLLVGFFISFAGEFSLNFLLENGIVETVPVTWAPTFLLYFFISMGMLINNSRMWMITQDKIFRSMEDAVFAFDTAGHVVEINKPAYDILSLTKKTDKKENVNIEYVSDSISSLIVNGKQRNNFINKLTDLKSAIYRKDIEFRINDEKEYYKVKICPIFDKFNRTIGKLLTLTDITAVKEKENQLYYQSYHDKLTGIYNRLYFEEELNRLDTKRQYPISIIIGDINGLKLINNAYGHDKGDEVLKKIARIFKSSLRHEDILSRWGGDEFVIILPKTEQEHALKIIDRIKEKCTMQSTAIMPLNISMGFAVKKSSRAKIHSIVKEAEDMMNEYKLLENDSARHSIILSLKNALEERDYETEEHAMRIANLSMDLGKKMNLKYNELNELRLVAILHDIGKISISDSIILKPGKLTPEEWDIIKTHPEAGYRLAKSSRDLEQIAKGILYHHERWDGNGYPKGLKGKKIPVFSRIVSIADAFDAMTNDRPYRKALSSEAAIEEIKKESGSQFDPDLAKKFIGILLSESNDIEVEA
ncbi:MAG: diguanylate cyclase [Actinomycetota bacterium]|nr:diguanylate cyclase [Actinomycetota bacterium]